MSLQYVIKTLHVIVDTVALFLILTVLFFGSYNIWDNYQIYNSASSNKFESYQPDPYDPDEQKTVDERFTKLTKINPDVFGWLHLFGTQINYPLVQGKTNQQYLNLDPLKNFSLSGSLFLDSYTPKDFSHFSSVIYGHHMEKHKMFGDLDSYRQESYAKAHSRGNIYYNQAYHGFDVVTFVDTDAYDPYIYNQAETTEQKQALIDYLKKVGEYQLTDMSLDDHLVMLSTCADGTDKRYIVVVKLKDTAYPEPQREVYSEQSTPQKIIKKYWWVTFAILPLVIAVVIYLFYQRRKSEKEDESDEEI